MPTLLGNFQCCVCNTAQDRLLRWATPFSTLLHCGGDFIQIFELSSSHPSSTTLRIFIFKLPAPLTPGVLSAPFFQPLLRVSASSDRNYTGSGAIRCARIAPSLSLFPRAPYVGKKLFEDPLPSLHRQKYINLLHVVDPGSSSTL